MPDAKNLETEVKIAFDDPAEARRRLESLGARLTQARHFEDNRLYDREGLPLKAAKKLLRLRTVGERTILTYKAPVPGEHRYKVLEEEESEVADGAAMVRILAGLGFTPVYRYQKYRTLYALEGLSVCLDETPIGCFVELEGEPAAIDRVAGRLGVAPEDYIRLNYRDLQERAAAERGLAEAGDMVFESES